MSSAEGVLLITGSRSLKSQPELLQWFSQLAFSIACKRGWEIYVGDAQGVDQAIIAASENHAESVPLTVWGCQAVGKTRTIVPPHTKIVLTEGGSLSGRGIQSCYIIRDKRMVEAAAKHTLTGILALWDGKSPGTRTTYRVAQTLNIQGIVYGKQKEIIKSWEKKVL